ncbi:TRAP transporter small permease [Castellaniella daejeonensis]|jgi:TRAP-type C4-dicarboxylate transport system permease small subunit|uniref:TRAP transporter small permease protein n=1 Tax=Castellaniella daejeonensis TaxID=659013 RepID=A0ABN0TUN0_9BURK|nr:TRAP transporter small permease [Castellaniella sp.]HET8702335.1 TRAP transporter small permease [Castellaniella sp.]
MPDDHAADSADPLAYAPPTDPPLRVSLRFEDWLTVLTLGALACITLANVIVRYLTSESFAWTEEISIFLLIVLTMSASSSAFVRLLHIRIELLADGGSPERRRRFALAAGAVSLLFFAGLTVLLGRMALDEYNWGDTSPAIGVPTWWYSMWLPVLSAIITLRLAGILRRAWGQS